MPCSRLHPPLEQDPAPAARRDDIDDLLIDITAKTAAALAVRAESQQRGYLTEQRDFAPVFAEQLAVSVKGMTWRPPKPGERKVDWPEHFPRVGNVDALIADRLGRTRPVSIELMCDSSVKGLSACA